MMNSWIKAAGVAAMVVSAPIIAQETLGDAGRGGGMGMLRMADSNGDGVVTRDEWVAAADARFARMNHDGDRALDRADRRSRTGVSPGSADAATPTGAPVAIPRTRNISPEQYRAGAMRRFDRIDTNHDGKIDQTEMAAAATLMRARRAAHGEGMDGASAAPPPSE